MEKKYCTKCNAILTNQKGFDPDGNFWICKKCGAFLYNPDNNVTFDDSAARFKDVYWFCDRCGTCLNNQSGFTDWTGTWTCAKCGYTNEISEDNIVDDEEDDAYEDGDNYAYSYDNDDNSRANYYSDDSDDDYDCYNDDDYDEDDEDEEDEDDDDEDEDEDEEDDDEDEEDYDNNDDDFKYSFNNSASAKNKGNNTAGASRHLFVKFILVLILISGVFLAYSYINNYFSAPIKVGVDSSKAIELEYHELSEMLSNAGFTNISAKPIADLSYELLDRENIVESISVDGDTVFSQNSRYPKNCQIIILYHSAKSIEIPFSSNKLKNKDYRNIVSELKDLGFVDICVKSEPDLVIGLFHKENEIKSITINGISSFDVGSSFRIDAEIVIVYHCFKK